MDSELQRLVDSVATRLKRPAIVEDRRQRLVVYSRHSEPVDAVRHASILQRCVPVEVTAWLERFELAKARSPVRVPANPSLGMLPRVCLPIRHHDLLLGYLWFIDEAEPMTADRLALAESAAQEFALALYREVLAGELASHRETEALRNLLLPESDPRAYAAHTLVDGGHFDPAAGVVVLVARPVLPPGSRPDEHVRLAVEHALLSVRHQLPSRRALHLVSYDQGVLLVGTDGADAEPVLRRSIEQLDHALRTAPSAIGPPASFVIGVGEPRTRLEDAYASSVEAGQAARVAASMPEVGRVARWGRLGIHRLLVALSDDPLGAPVAHPGLDRLLADPRALPLLQTLETYLDLAGNALAAAERLRLHRTSLYYRLRRVEDLAATDLKDGHERLSLHLALKLARLSGRYRPGLTLGQTCP